MKLDQDTLDSRDLEERIVELEKNNDLTDQEKEELHQLAAIKKDVEDYSEEWEDGITFVSQYYWREYCEEFAYDCGYIEDINRVNTNPLVYCVDWEKWASEMKYDYTSIEINKVDYYFRAY
tara:strand:+ start:850 stop:1212 length:363 start_codon:yes stop_codon:yes gene_type:complete